MQRILLITQRSAFSDAAAREGQDLALALAATEHQVSLLYRAEAVLQLRPLQSPVALKDFTKAQKLFGLYDVAAVYVCQPSLEAYGLSAADLQIAELQVPVQLVSIEQQAALLRQHDQILVT